MDTLKINDRECIRCGECKSKCNFGAIKWNKTQLW
jgi:MinD superfamily P-loop ATPase